MATLKETVFNVMQGYAGKGLNGISYLTTNDEYNIFNLVCISKLKDKRIANFGLIAWLRDDRVIIESDMTDKPLYEALMQAGIPREQIVLVYAGEEAPFPWS